MTTMKVFAVFAMLIAVVLTIPVSEIQKEYNLPARYEFKYGVKDEHTKDIKEQYEKRDGDKVTGYYKLVEPDGTTRTVQYTADKLTGFQAQVLKSGHAIHPQQYEKVVVPVKKVELPKYEVSLPSYSQESAAGAQSYSNVKF